MNIWKLNKYRHKIGASLQRAFEMFLVEPGITNILNIIYLKCLRCKFPLVPSSHDYYLPNLLTIHNQ